MTAYRRTTPQELDEKIEDAHRILAAARATYFEHHHEAAAVLLFSGGNDSTVLAHLMRHHATHAAHANTGIGIDQTRQFVRDTCRRWELPLLERAAIHERDTYEAMVIDQGFPGPGMHYKMYQRLKERALRQVRAELVSNPRRERILFLAGRRREESKRRKGVPEHERDGAVVWVSPLANWTRADMNAYRARHPNTPRNTVSDHLHMSGECLCGSFAKPGELDEIGFFYPEVKAHIQELEAKVKAAGHPAWRCVWGWGGHKETIDLMRRGGMSDDQIVELLRPSESGPLCHDCDNRFSSMQDVLDYLEPPLPLAMASGGEL